MRRSPSPGPGVAASPADIAVLTVQRAFELLATGADGLSTDEAGARLRAEGPNIIPVAHGPGAIVRLTSQMTHLFARMLWVAALLALIGRMPALAGAIVVVVVVNGVFSFVEEERATKAALALRELVPAMATAIRDGVRSQISVPSLVIGDVIVLREGDRVPADARLIESDGVTIDESTLTGESVPVVRAALDDGTGAVTLVFAGSYVSSGSGRAVVFATGTHSRLGGIARMTGDVVRRPTPLRLDLDRAVRWIAIVAVACGLVFFGVSMILGMQPRDGFLFAVGVIVALVPEGLLPTLTLSLAMSATRMAHLGALVRHLESVETLGATTVICSDKTGTMTTNQMTARQAWTLGRFVTAKGSGWATAGALFEDDRPLGTDALAELGPLIHAAALCNNSRLECNDGRWRCVGDPTEGALQVFAQKGGLGREEAERTNPRVHEFAFDSSRRRMTTLQRRPDGSLVAYTKGSPEAVLDVATWVLDGATRRALEVVDREAIVAAVDEMAAVGLRVLGLATRELVGGVSPSAADVEHDLAFVGLIGLEDPVRPEVREAVAACRAAGIRIVMITGDHPATARSVADAVGLAPGSVLTGTDLPVDDDALRRLLDDPALSVLARIAPEQKLRIARALQSEGAVVAMTGDGVNDAPGPSTG